MINLLSPNDKKMLRAARRNTVWSRYTFIVVVLLITVNIILGLTYFLIQSQAQLYQSQITNNQELSDKQYSSTKAQAAKFRKELATAKSILENETNYSTIIVNIARTVPSGCVLSTLTLNNQAFNMAQSLSFKCRANSDVLRLKSALEENTETFDKVNIISTNTADTTEAEPYPISINMSLVLKKPSASNKVAL